MNTDQQATAALKTAEIMPAAEVAQSIMMKARTPTVAVGMMIEEAIRRGADPDAIEKLVSLSERVMRLQAEREFNVALHHFRASITPVPKTKTATMKSGWSYQYAPLDQVEKHCMPSLRDNGLSYTFHMQPPASGWIETQVQLRHIGGHSILSSFYAPVGNNEYISEMQNVAASDSYCKRRALMSVLGLSTEDDEDALTRGNNQPESQGPRRKSDGADRGADNDDRRLITEKQVKLLAVRLTKAKASEMDFKSCFGVEKLSELARGDMDKALSWIDENAVPF